MDDIKPSFPLDYQQAAEWLLVALSFIAGKLPNHPVPAGQLCAHVFPRELRRHWSHETRRRRIRDAAVVARKIILVYGDSCASPSNQGMKLVGSGKGYWLTGDPRVMSWYAGQRRRRGLTDLAAASQNKRHATHAGQKSLFNVVPTPSSAVVPSALAPSAVTRASCPHSGGLNAES